MHLQAALDRQGAARMIGIGMTEQHQVQRLHPQLAQARQHDPLAQVMLTQCRPGVVQHRVLPGAQHERQALADIQLPDLHLAVRYPLSRRKGSQQEQWPAEHTHWQATGQ
ncbi:hypothetical protein D3C79_871040 [compost metagenome]